MQSKWCYTNSAPTGVQIHCNVNKCVGKTRQIRIKHLSLANRAKQKQGLTKNKFKYSRCGFQQGTVTCGSLFFPVFLFFMFSSSACNKGLQLLGSAAAVSTSVLLRDSSRQILITCWQTKRQARGKNKWWEISAASCEMEDGEESPLGWVEGERASEHVHNKYS